MSDIQPPSNAPRRKLILVLGMHRSGTSLLSGLLAQAGATPGLDIMAAAADNPRGFWENQRIVSLNEQLLNRFGLSWSSWAPLPEGWQQSSEATDYLGSLETVLDEEFADQPLCVVKDPRICRLLPLWRQLAESQDMALYGVSIVRPAAEVVQSLKQRDGIGDAHGRALWLRYNLEWSLHTKGLPQAHTSYETVLAEPAATLQAIADLCGEPLQAVDASFADAGLKHHGNLEDSPWCTALYDRLARGALDWPAEYGEALLAVSGELADARHDLAAGVVSVDSLGADALSGARETLLFEQAQEARLYAASMEQELHTGRDYIEAMESELEQRQRYAANLKEELAARDSDIVEKQGFIAALEVELEGREQFVADLKRELDTRSEYADSLAGELTTKTQYIDDLTVHLERKDQEFAEAAAAHQAYMEAQQAHMEAQQAHAETQQAESEQYARSLRDELARREEYTRSLAAEVERKDAYGHELEAEIARLREELETQTARLDEELQRFRHLRWLTNKMKGNSHPDDQ